MVFFLPNWVVQDRFEGRGILGLRFTEPYSHTLKTKEVNYLMVLLVRLRCLSNDVQIMLTCIPLIFSRSQELTFEGLRFGETHFLGCSAKE